MPHSNLVFLHFPRLSDLSLSFFYDKSYQCLAVAPGQGPSRRSHSNGRRVGHCWLLCGKSLVTEPQPEGVVPLSGLRWLLFVGFFLRPYSTARRSDRNFGFMGAFKHYWLLGHRDCNLQGNAFPHTNNRSNLRHYLRPASHNLRPLNLDLSFLTGTETDLAAAVPNASLLKLTKKCCPGLVDGDWEPAGAMCACRIGN